MQSVCSHLDQIQQVAPTARGCEACLQSGSGWVHLRVCQTCGHVGCCDSSPNQHASQHFRETGHPIVAPLGQAEGAWMWCYVDEVVL